MSDKKNESDIKQMAWLKAVETARSAMKMEPDERVVLFNERLYTLGILCALREIDTQELIEMINWARDRARSAQATSARH